MLIGSNHNYSISSARIIQISQIAFQYFLVTNFRALRALLSCLGLKTFVFPMSQSLRSFISHKVYVPPLVTKFVFLHQSQSLCSSVSHKVCVLLLVTKYAQTLCHRTDGILRSVCGGQGSKFFTCFLENSCKNKLFDQYDNLYSLKSNFCLGFLKSRQYKILQPFD